jgi:hypothetical protein
VGSDFARWFLSIFFTTFTVFILFTWASASQRFTRMHQVATSADFTPTLVPRLHWSPVFAVLMLGSETETASRRSFQPETRTLHPEQEEIRPVSTLRVRGRKRTADLTYRQFCNTCLHIAHLLGNLTLTALSGASENCPPPG